MTRPARNLELVFLAASHHLGCRGAELVALARTAEGQRFADFLLRADRNVRAQAVANELRPIIDGLRRMELVPGNCHAVDDA